MRSVAFFSGLERETGISPDWRQTGSLRISLSPERTQEHEQMARVAHDNGLEVRFLGSHELSDVAPSLEFGKIHSALWCPSDGYLQPNSLVNAYVAGAKASGVTFATNAAVTAISAPKGKVVSVTTKNGTVSTSLVINAAGPWAGAVANLVGIRLPVVPVRHEYFISAGAPGWHRDVPVLRVPDLGIYARAEGEAVLCGGWEANALSLDPDSLRTQSILRVDPDLEVLAGFHQSLASVLVGLDDIGVQSIFRGYPAFSPDGRFIVGPVRGVEGFVMAAACNAHGVSGSAGLAEHVLESMQPDPTPYVRSLSPDRFLDSPFDGDQSRQRAQRIYETYYALGASAQGGLR